MRSLVMEGKYSFPIMLDQGEVAVGVQRPLRAGGVRHRRSGRLVDQFVGASDFAKLNQIADGLAGG